MSLVTKIFLTNWIFIAFITFADTKIFKDAIEKFAPHTFGAWAFASLISIPMWVAYLIWSI